MFETLIAADLAPERLAGVEILDQQLQHPGDAAGRLRGDQEERGVTDARKRIDGACARDHTIRRHGDAVQAEAIAPARFVDHRLTGERAGRQLIAMNDDDGHLAVQPAAHEEVVGRRRAEHEGLLASQMHVVAIGLERG